MELEGDTGSMGAVDAGGLRRTALVPMEGVLVFSCGRGKPWKSSQQD